MIRTALSHTYCTLTNCGFVRSASYGSRDRTGAVTKPTAPRFTGLVTRIDLDAAHGAAAKSSGYRDGRR